MTAAQAAVELEIIRARVYCKIIFWGEVGVGCMNPRLPANFEIRPIL